jgi:hypothetical protein
MSRANLWSALVFAAFAFATVIIFFWIREGSLSKAGQSMDSFLGETGQNVAKTADGIAPTTGEAINNATGGDNRT